MTTTLQNKRANMGWAFGLRWVLVNAVGGAIGLPLLVYLPAEIKPVTLALVVGGLLSWGGLALLQWFLFRPQLDRASGWLIATLVGGVAGLLLASSVHRLIPTPAGGHTPVGDCATANLPGSALGGLLGILQWLVLRRQVYRAGWWVLASTVGWAFATTALVPFALMVFALIHYPLFLSIVVIFVAGATAGVVSGIVTGIALVWLFRHRVVLAPDAA
jgi:hypothetical protein